MRADRKAHSRPARCVYCGRLTMRRSLGAPVCHNHDDLPKLDPHYVQPNQWASA